MSEIESKISAAESFSDKIYDEFLLEEKNSKKSDPEAEKEYLENLEKMRDDFDAKLFDLEKFFTKNSTEKSEEFLNLRDRFLGLQSLFWSFREKIARKVFTKKFNSKFENRGGYFSIDLTTIKFDELPATGFFRFVFKFENDTGEFEEKSIAISVKDIRDFKSRGVGSWKFFFARGGKGESEELTETDAGRKFVFPAGKKLVEADVQESEVVLVGDLVAGEDLEKEESTKFEKFKQKIIDNFLDENFIFENESIDGEKLKVVFSNRGGEKFLVEFYIDPETGMGAISLSFYLIPTEINTQNVTFDFSQIGEAIKFDGILWAKFELSEENLKTKTDKITKYVNKNIDRRENYKTYVPPHFLEFQ
jgi:hypothetical protein